MLSGGLRWLTVVVLVGAVPVLADDGVDARLLAKDIGEGKDELCGHARSLIARFEREQQGDSALREGYADTDVIHCLLDLEVTLSPNSVIGTNTLDVASRRDGLTQFTLDLRSNLTVDAVTVGGAAATYTRPGHQLVIDLDRAYSVGEGFQVAVTYHGLPQNLNWGSFEFGSHNGTAIVASLSEPYYAHTWWPCKESIDDKFTMNMWVTAPSWMTVASNGVLQGKDALTGGRSRTRWHEGYPISVYLVSVAMTNYTKWTEWCEYPGGSMPVEFYIYPEDVATVQPLVADLVTMIETLSRPDVFGQYPFIEEKYGIAQFEWCCGMEHQTITSQGSFPERRNVHEMAHSWWGNSITCLDWHHIWINEGFARYAEALWFALKPGGGHAQYLAHLQAYRPGSYGGTVYRYDVSTADAIFSIDNAYNKGAWVLHMLRHVVGDAAFFDALAVYRAAHEGRSANTEDFRAAVESVHGQDLDWFFQEWIYDPGVPYYRYGWRHEFDGLQHWLRLHVQQYQSSYRVFHMPIDVTVTYSGGASETQVIWNDQAWQWYTLPVTGDVSSVQLDGQTWILRGAADNTTYVDELPSGDVHDVIVESRDAAGAVTSPPTYIEEGDWFDSTIKSTMPGLVGTGSRWIAYELPNSGTDNATFVPAITRPGRYEVYVTWDVGANCYDAQYTIRHPHGPSVRLIDQIPDGVAGANANTWVSLGQYLFPAGQSETDASVNVSETTVSGKPHSTWNQRVYADAALWSYVGPWPKGDADADGEVGAADWPPLADCLNGPDQAYANPSCVIFDFDEDDDVDLPDAAAFSNAIGSL
ncbi:MAG: hypothetical protein JXB13_02250 [Phycisphaerae bacterium]|nr:hypothetical protein [Phycisphaerae bacterium]